MWQRFSERARKVVFYAQEEAQKFGEGYVSTEHLLLGIAREDDSTAARMLDTLGVPLERVRHEVERQLPRGDARPSADMTLTPRAKRVIDLAYDEARYLNNNYIGTEHLLLGLIREGDGLAGRVLAKLGVELEKARRIVLDLQGVEGEQPVEPKSAFETLKERFLGRQPSPFSLPVTYDLHVLHPVDQMLISLLSDKTTALVASLRERCQILDWAIPAIVATMTKWNQNDATLTDVLTKANDYAQESGRTVELRDLYRAAYAHTTNEVRAVLSGIELDPPAED